MRRIAVLCTALASQVLVSGCASLGNEKRQTLPVDSDPPEATASWDGQAVTTPGAIVVHRKARHASIRFEKPGYETCTVELTRKHDGAYWSNLALIPAGLLLGGAIGYSTTSHKGFFSGWEEAIVGGVLGGAVVPLAGMLIDSGNGRGYEQRPAKLEVVLARLEPGRGVAPSGSEPRCALSTGPKKSLDGRAQQARGLPRTAALSNCSVVNVLHGRSPRRPSAGSGPG